MAVKALYDYDYPSADRAEVFGDDMLVNVMWTDNPMFASAACFRVPSAMPWSEFRSQLVDPWAGSDPDFEPAAARDWRIEGEPIEIDDSATVGSTGVVHKGLITFRTGESR